MTAGHYIDAAEFTRLFRHRRKNHAAICVELDKLARACAARVWFRNAGIRQDVQQEALVWAIERIGKFTYGAGANAFNYFSSVIFNSVTRQLARRLPKEARAKTFTDVTRQVSRRTLESESFDHARACQGRFDAAKPYARI